MHGSGDHPRQEKLPYMVQGTDFGGTIGDMTGHILAFKYLTYAYNYIRNKNITLPKHTPLRMYAYAITTCDQWFVKCDLTYIISITSIYVTSLAKTCHVRITTEFNLIIPAYRHANVNSSVFLREFC